jgi:hypothetical protein
MSDRVRDAFEVLMEQMEDPPTWEEVRVPVASSRRVSTKQRPILVAAFAVAAVIVGIVTLNVLFAPVKYQLPTPDIAAGEVQVLEDPLVVRGTPSLEPRFDTSTLGDEIVLSEPDGYNRFVSWADQGEFPDSDLSKVIVAGSINDSGASAGMAVVVPRDAPDNVEWCILTLTESGASCATAPDFQTPIYLIRHPEPVTSTPGTLSWGPAPEGTSVVTLSYRDTRMWQRPVSGIVLFPIDTPSEQFVITTLDQEGNEIYTDQSIEE